jgi:hypothetical protein
MSGQDNEKLIAIDRAMQFKKHLQMARDKKRARENKSEKDVEFALLLDDCREHGITPDTKAGYKQILRIWLIQQIAIEARQARRSSGLSGGAMFTSITQAEEPF